jgi:hypothetical protein
MKSEGPSLEALMDRLSVIHTDFLKDFSRSPDDRSGIYLPAMINDLLVDTGDIPLKREEAVEIEKFRTVKNLPQLAGIFCHIYHDAYFLQNKVKPGLVRGLIFSQKLAALGPTADNAGQFVSDPDRREELCRIALDAAGLFPAGESEKTAAERLTALDSVERKKILDKTRDAQKRAREIREAMLQKEAEEAASKMSRE